MSIQTLIPRRDAPTAAYPLAPTQQGMLVHGSVDSEDGIYVQQLVVTLNEGFDVSIFRAGLAEPCRSS